MNVLAYPGQLRHNIYPTGCLFAFFGVALSFTSPAYLTVC
jgi:hypothetical protein